MIKLKENYKSYLDQIDNNLYMNILEYINQILKMEVTKTQLLNQHSRFRHKPMGNTTIILRLGLAEFKFH